MRLRQLHVEATEMIGEPRPPTHCEQVARLKQRPHTARPPSPHKAEMTAMPSCENLGHGIRFAERLSREKDALVAPVHAPDYRRSRGKSCGRGGRGITRSPRHRPALKSCCSAS